LRVNFVNFYIYFEQINDDDDDDDDDNKITGQPLGYSHWLPYA